MLKWLQVFDRRMRPSDRRRQRPNLYLFLASALIPPASRVCVRGTNKKKNNMPFLVGKLPDEKALQIKWGLA
jgi:hypothetical protein